MKMHCEAEEGTMIFMGYHQRMVASKRNACGVFVGELVWFLFSFLVCFVTNILHILISMGNATFLMLSCLAMPLSTVLLYCHCKKLVCRLCRFIRAVSILINLRYSYKKLHKESSIADVRLVKSKFCNERKIKGFWV